MEDIAESLDLLNSEIKEFEQVLSGNICNSCAKQKNLQCIVWIHI